jgi:hypothetical protein
MRKLTAVVIAGALAACGGSSSDGGGGGNATPTLTSTGTVAVTATHSVSALFTTSCNFTGLVEQGIAVLVIAASDIPNICGLVQAGQAKANEKGILIGIASLNALGATPPTIGPGTYSISAGRSSLQSAFATVSSDDSTCKPVASEDASSGTVTISSTANGRVLGTIDATLSSGKITGSFDAPNCAVTFPSDFCTTLNPVPPTPTCVP